MWLFLATFIFVYVRTVLPNSNIPIVVTTWNFVEATDRAWDILSAGHSALDAVEVGAATCEQLQCDGTVGFGGSPDEDGETTLDAMIMDGRDMNVGAVAALRGVKRAISVARRILDHTSHSILVGDQATQFALKMGFKKESLSTNTSIDLWRNWKENNCQPNFWQDVKPDPRSHCGPYKVSHFTNFNKRDRYINKNNHDTIGIIAIDDKGDIAAGTSSNGAKFKIPGRVGDSPIPGAGAYADNAVGAAVATGDGDVMLRFSPSFLAVEEMRRGAPAAAAARTAAARVAAHYPAYSGAVLALTRCGEYAAACHGLPLPSRFPFVVRHNSTAGSLIQYVQCV